MELQPRHGLGSRSSDNFAASENLNSQSSRTREISKNSSKKNKKLETARGSCSDSSSIRSEIVRYLSSSERTMKNLMDSGVSTVGDLLQFRTEVEIDYQFTLDCLDLIYNKYEMLQLNTVFDERKKKYYWAKFAKELVFQTHDLGVVNESEAHKTFNEIMQKGISDLEPIWRFYFMKINKDIRNKSNQGPQASSEANCYGCMPKETSNDFDPTGGQVDKDNTGYSYCIFFIMSHALVDGIGISNIIADYFTTVCQKLKLRQQAESIDEPNGSIDFVKVSPPYEELVPNLIVYRVFSAPLSFVLSRLLKLYLHFKKVPLFRHPLFDSPNLVPNRRGNPDLPIACGSHMMKFAIQDWENFQTFRKEHNLTVTGLALAIFGVSLVKFAYKGFDWPTTTLAAHILRDPRRYFKTDLDSRALVANYVASGLIILLPLLKNKPRRRSKTRKPIDKIVIDMARLITQQIRGNVKNFQTFLNGEIQRRVSRDPVLVERLCELFSTDNKTFGRFSLIQFSNLGKVTCSDTENCGDFEGLAVEKSIAFADQARAGDCFCNVLVNLQGQLFWTISYPLQLFSPEKVEALGHEIQQIWHDVITVATTFPCTSATTNINDKSSVCNAIPKNDNIDVTKRQHVEL